MEPKLQLSLNNQKATDFIEGDTTLINFSRNKSNFEYRLTFLNKNKYKSLTFTLISDLRIESYFEYIKANGHNKFVGYHKFKEKERTVDIHDCIAFTIVIPRKLNHDVCTPLSLVSLHAE